MNLLEQSRFIKNLTRKGYSTKQAKMMLNILASKTNINDYKEGDKVKLNLKSIQEQPDYPKMNPKYKQWVEDNKDKVFTVEYDEKHGDNSTLVCLKEDTTDPKWLWWVGNLEKVK